MIVPRFWAEARVQHKENGKQFTVRRFGWSNVDLASAQAHADERAEEAMKLIRSGVERPRREPKVPYNGADGVPIREEVVAEHGEVVITRNSYGALCLNTPDVLFADVDFEVPGSPIGCGYVFCLSTIAGLALAWERSSAKVFFIPLLIGALLSIWVLPRLRTLWISWRGGNEQVTLQRIRAFIAAHPDWRVRVYSTPAGLRVLALHRKFSPVDAVTEEFFAQIGADETYVRMCTLQKCFRARVSPKPWRMGMIDRFGYGGVWPIAESSMAARNAWVEQYQRKALNFASCRFLEEIGCGPIDDAARRVMELHDTLCQAGTELPIA